MFDILKRVLIKVIDNLAITITVPYDQPFIFLFLSSPSFVKLLLGK